MTKSYQTRTFSEEIALVVTPLAVLVATIVPWLSQSRFGAAGQSGFNVLLCLAGILLLSTLLGVGFRYYKAHPFVGMLTALTLLCLSPVSQTAMTWDVWQFLSGLVTLGGGGAMTITFLVLSLRTMIREGESVGPTEASDSPDMPDTRWLRASDARGGSQHVRGAD